MDATSNARLPRHLLVPTRETRNIDLLMRVCFWSVVHARRIPPGQEDQLPESCNLTNTAVHGGTSFCRKVATALGGRVLEPADDFLPRLPAGFTRREIKLMPLGEARSLAVPRFVKPVNDKHFSAGVYASGTDLPLDAAHDAHLVLVSEPVGWDCEVRLFILDRRVKTSSPYQPPGTPQATQAQHTAARDFAAKVLSDGRTMLPRAAVLDVGFIKGNGWAVVEANTAVMSSIYDCDPIEVLALLPHGLEAF